MRLARFLAPATAAVLLLAAACASSSVEPTEPAEPTSVVPPGFIQLIYPAAAFSIHIPPDWDMRDDLLSPVPPDVQSWLNGESEVLSENAAAYLFIASRLESARAFSLTVGVAGVTADAALDDFFRAIIIQGESETVTNISTETVTVDGRPAALVEQELTSSPDSGGMSETDRAFQLAMQSGNAFWVLTCSITGEYTPEARELCESALMSFRLGS